MKKLIYLPLLLLTLVVGVNKVNALENVYISNFYNFYDFWATLEDNEDYPSNVISTLISMYNSNTNTSVYPYYVILKNASNDIVLKASDTNDIIYYESNGYPYAKFNSSFDDLPTFSYSFSNSSYTSTLQGANVLGSLIWYSANTSLYFKTYGYSSIQLPSYSNLELDVSYPLITINNGDTIPTYMSLTNGEPSADFTEVDMSDYDYIILSLKDYDTEPFNTTIYSLGVYVLHPFTIMV